MKGIRTALKVTAVAATLVVTLVVVAPSSAAAPAPSWAQAQINLVTSRGLMGGDATSFRPDDPLTASDLAELLTGLTGRPPAIPANPSAPVTIAGLDSALVRALGLSDAARQFANGVRAAGLAPPARFGTEAVARLLGLRFNHPYGQDGLELLPQQPATRAEAAYSAAKILGESGWEIPWVKTQAAAFAPTYVSGWQRTVLQTAVSLIGYPYVWGGASERPQVLFGAQAPGGFDCSGFVWRLYKLSSYAAGTPLAGELRGRTTYAMSGETPATTRIPFASLQPGDLIFFGASGEKSRPDQVDHMGVYLGGGWFIQSSSQGIAIAPLNSDWNRTRFAWGRSPLAEAGLR